MWTNESLLHGATWHLKLGPSGLGMVQPPFLTYSHGLGSLYNMDISISYIIWFENYIKTKIGLLNHIKEKLGFHGF